MIDTLLLHVGFPKTGTTTLQESLFPNAPGLTFLGKSRSHLPEFLDAFRELVNYGTTFHIRNRRHTVLEDMLGEFVGNSLKRVLVSLEGLSNPFADSHYTQPKDVYRKVSDIQSMLAPLIDKGVKVKILVTVRQQTELIPSLFSQVYLQGFSTGLFKPSYEGFLDFMLGDNTMGFGPDFQFDAFLDHCVEEFGAENVFAASMKGFLSRSKCRDMGALADFLNLDENLCIELIGGSKQNVRNCGDGVGRRMITFSPGAHRFHKNTGISITSKAFGLSDRLRISCGKHVFWQIQDHSKRIEDYYMRSNIRLAEKYGISFQ